MVEISIILVIIFNCDIFIYLLYVCNYVFFINMFYRVYGKMSE